MTAVPVGGAGAFMVTVPVMLRVSPTVPELRLTETLGTDTVTVAVPGLQPGAEAVTRVLPGDPGVTVMVVAVAFWGMVTEETMVATV